MFDNKQKTLTGIVIIMFIGLMIFIFLTGGVSSITNFLKKLLIGVVIIFILIMIGVFIYRLFKREPVNLVENDRKDIIEAGVMSKPEMLGDLYFTGDKEHSRFKVGTIAGYCQIQSYSNQFFEEAEDEEGNKILTVKDMYDRERGLTPNAEDCFIVYTLPPVLRWFENPKVIRCYPYEHSQMIGDIDVYAISMVKKYGYYFPNRAFLDVVRIDKSVLMEAYRGQVYEYLKDFNTLQRRASGLDSDHKKELDSKKLLKIPTALGEMENR